MELKDARLKIGSVPLYSNCLDLASSLVNHQEGRIYVMFLILPPLYPHLVREAGIEE